MKPMNNRLKITTILLVCMLVIFGGGHQVKAADQVTTLRVAFYPLDGFFEYNEQGIESGYGVELLDKISQYTGFDFEYVKADSWESTKQMLLDGEADIRMPATLPRTPSTTLGYSEASVLDTYNVLLTLNTKDDLFYQDYDTIKTLKIAISQGFYEVNNVQEYFDQIGISSNQIIYCDTYEESRNMLDSGEADALISNVMDYDDTMKMLDRFDSASNYITMPIGSKYLNIIDEAISEIKLEEPLFLSNLYEKWFPERTMIPLTNKESEYLAELQEITFAFQPNEGYLSHYVNGEYLGIYVEIAKAICKKLNVDYNAVSNPDALAGTVDTDVYAGFFYDKNYAQEYDFSLSSPIRDINYYIIQKKETHINTEDCTIAAIKKFKYTSDYLQRYYHSAKFIYFDSYEDCMKAVVSGKADMTIINNYIAEYYMEMYQFSDLSAKLSTDYSHMFCFATADENEVLASILSKGLSMISDEEMSQIYISGQEDRPQSSYIKAAIYQSPVEVLVIVSGIIALLVTLVLLLLFARRSKKQNEELENALSAKGDFLSRMSHDMRTPMNGILGLSYLMEKETQIDRLKKYIPELRESGKYLLQLINDVLDVNKIETGNLSLRPKVCDEKLVFDSIISMITPDLKKKNIEFHFEKKNIEWKYMLLDEQRVKQIFLNLLTNAVKFTPEEGRIDFQMELVSQTDEIIVDKFIIKDNGIGMSEEFLPQLFEPFAQEARIDTDNSTGTGLGMPIVKQLVELMKGTILVESEVDRGTEVTLFLSFPLADKPYEKETSKEKEQEDFPENLKILMCEDHPINAKIAIKLLEQKKVIVTWAENGSIGVNKFKNSEEGYFDMILMDIRMPVMNGLEASKEIRAMDRKDAKSIPIIAMTANAYDSDMKASLEAGINKHLAKPVDPKVLYETISECVIGGMSNGIGKI